MITKLTQITLIAGIAVLCAQTGNQLTFATPEEGRNALVQAAAKGLDALRDFFGEGAAEILRTGDDVQDRTLLETFNRRAAEKTGLEPDPKNANHVSIVVGNEQVPFAVPLIRKKGRWYFDLAEGEAELRRRIIGGNELDAAEICRGYVEAQQIYAQTDHTGKGLPQYARKIISTRGTQDGLYWPGEDSPVAAGFAKAVLEGYQQPTGGGNSYHGYQFKILLAQGPDAQGGAQDYLVNGLMIGGFALVAWPAEYGVSGITTFIVNQDGVVYEKDLGPKTTSLAQAMTRFNPDRSWHVTQ